MAQHVSLFDSILSNRIPIDFQSTTSFLTSHTAVGKGDAVKYYGEERTDDATGPQNFAPRTYPAANSFRIPIPLWSANRIDGMVGKCAIQS